MTQEEKILLTLLKDSLHDTNTAISLTKEQIGGLYALASRHHLTHLAGEQLYRRGYLANEAEWQQKFELAQQIALMQDIRMSGDAEQIFAFCEAEKIDYMPLKGTVVKSLYPREHMRTSSDVDFLVRREDIPRLRERVTAAGYTVKAESSDGEAASHDIEIFSPSGLILEAHFCLFEYDEKISSFLENVWETAVLKEGTAHHYLMSPELFYFYHIAHLLKHFMRGGCGIRGFMDLYLMDRKMPVDEGQLDRLLSESGIKTFYDTCLKLSKVWFGDEPHDDVSRSMEDYILSSGVFGRKEHYIAITQSQSSGQVSATMSRLFLKKEILKNQYPVLQKHPWLSPFYQIKRWFDVGLSSGIKRYRNWQKANAKTERETVDATREMLKKLDLLDKKL